MMGQKRVDCDDGATMLEVHWDGIVFYSDLSNILSISLNMDQYEQHIGWLGWKSRQLHLLFPDQPTSAEVYLKVMFYDVSS